MNKKNATYHMFSALYLCLFYTLFNHLLKSIYGWWECAWVTVRVEKNRLNVGKKIEFKKCSAESMKTSVCVRGATWDGVKSLHNFNRKKSNTHFAHVIRIFRFFQE